MREPGCGATPPAIKILRRDENPAGWTFKRRMTQQG